MKIKKISDLGLVAALCSLGFSIDSIDKSFEPKIHFCFRDQEDLCTAIEDYWQNKLSVDPLVFYQTLKTIKSRLYSGWS